MTLSWEVRRHPRRLTRDSAVPQQSIKSQKLVVRSRSHTDQERVWLNSAEQSPTPLSLTIPVLYDVLAYIAYAAAPISRRERVISHQALIFSRYFGKQQEFLDFVLDQYVREGVGELDQDKLPQLLELKYHDLRDAVVDLGSVSNIRTVLFIEFQEYLYSQKGAA